MPWGTCEESISGGSAFSMIWSHSGFQGLPPSSAFFRSIGVGGAGLAACAGDVVALAMKSTRLPINNDVLSADMLVFTVLCNRRLHQLRIVSASRYLQFTALRFPKKEAMPHKTPPKRSWTGHREEPELRALRRSSERRIFAPNSERPVGAVMHSTGPLQFHEGSSVLLGPQMSTGPSWNVGWRASPQWKIPNM